MGEAQKLTGKLGHLAEGANWVFHLLTHLYALIAFALSESKRLLADTSPEFRNICLSLKTGFFLNRISHVWKRLGEFVCEIKVSFYYGYFAN